MLKFLNVTKRENDFGVKVQHLNALRLREMGYSPSMVSLFIAANAPSHKENEALKGSVIEIKTFDL